MLYSELRNKRPRLRRPGSMRKLMILAALAAGCNSTADRPDKREPHLEMYNVQDIVWCYRSSAFVVDCEIPDHPKGCHQFEKRAKHAVSPTIWDDEKGNSLVFQNGLLIVRADDATQESVKSFLNSERAKASADVK